ncbi:GNAT family N-acetyltransferase [Paenibacillus sp. GD4]|uniref:GNAT family N-acetyltransferase n=1 Tax=Paenibacillus sp. GD4 TaxID=3068890 RepID=UPI002796D8E6|nr:GNAT family N-acetyltransferase [Paenibacillus sp. GD4]MDQ1913822.1 GNAT family N-acetyltransferase [Paenibacillus sp. GD4]
MKLVTMNHWDPERWMQAEPIYREAFPTGRKGDLIIRRLLEQHAGYLHLAVEKNEVQAMAISAPIKEVDALLIDYLAVRHELRGQGIGQRFLELLKAWTVQQGMKGMLLEIESDEGETNPARRRFWEQAGFTLTEYVHEYIWVPEPYQAMYLHLREGSKMPEEGEELFRHITHFHKKAWGLAK